MEAPAAGLSGQSFDNVIAFHVEKFYEKIEGGYKCRKCDVEIQQTTCTISIHTKLFDSQCAGAGEVRRVPLPYCPKCEGKPKNTSTCIHV